MIARMPKTLPFDEWPAMDQKAWKAATEGDFLSPEGGGAGSTWRPSTRRLVATQYGRWLSWLHERGALEPAGAIAGRVTKARIGEYLDEMISAGFSHYSQAGALQGIADAVRVMCPGENISFVGRAAGRISAGAVRARDLRGRMVDPLKVLELGRKLITQGSDETLTDRQRAIAFRDGLLLSLWTHRPLRIQNLSSIQIRKNLCQQRDGYRLVFDAEAMKSRTSWDCSWPTSIEHDLDVYLDQHRPTLLGSKADDNALWISQFGAGMPSSSVAQIIQLRTRAHFGHALNPHFMRHLAATRVAELDPTHRTDVAAILGHRSMSTSDRHYVLSSGMRAGEMYQAVLFPNRKGLTHKRDFNSKH